MVCLCQEREGKFEPEALDAWAEICEGKGNVVDVGAYTGIYTIAALKLGCAAWAFEPNPAVEGRLRVNIKENNRPEYARSWKVSGHAIGKDFGTTHFHYNPTVPLTSAGSIVPSGKKAARTMVEIRPLSALLSDRRIAGIKIDVEGAEVDVIDGAREIIQFSSPPMIIELLDETAVREVKERLVPAGYKARQLDPRNWLFRK